MAKNEDLFFTKEGVTLTPVVGSLPTPSAILTVPADGCKLLGLLVPAGTDIANLVLNDVVIGFVVTMATIIANPTQYAPNGLPKWTPVDANGNHYLNLKTGDVLKSGSNDIAGDNLIVYYEEY